MDRAGTETLASRIRSDGRLHIDLLERFGIDLLEVVAELEKTGVAHKDIKPENIGIRSRGKSDELHLVLFDFSLTTAPADNIRCGTPPYLDPFLLDRSRGRWDLAAERFSTAVTLFEMATGSLPQWGDGVSAPAAVGTRLKVGWSPTLPSVHDQSQEISCFQVGSIEAVPSKSTSSQPAAVFPRLSSK